MDWIDSFRRWLSNVQNSFCKPSNNTPNTTAFAKMCAERRKTSAKLKMSDYYTPSRRTIIARSGERYEA